MSDFRVFQGVRGQAGQPKALTRALKEHGVHAESYCNSVNKFSYDHDHSVDFKKLSDPAYFHKLFRELYDNFDVFHFHAGSFYNTPVGQFPCFLDLYLLRDLGKKIIFHFRGSEARIESECRKINPYHYYDLPDLDVSYIRFYRPDKLQRSSIELVRRVAHRIYVNDAEIQSYIPEGLIVPRAFESTVSSPIVTGNERPLVIHAPSRRAIKGTDKVFEVVEKLKSQGLDFEFKLVENLSHQQALDLYKNADIIVDQLRIGWYGVLTVEAMSMGKAVMCYIREDLKHHIPSPSPLAMTTMDSLEGDLKKLIQDKEYRQSVGNNAFQFFQDYHDANKVGEWLKNDIADLLQKSPIAPVEDPDTIIKEYHNKIYKSYAPKPSSPLQSISRKATKLKSMGQTLNPRQMMGVIVDINQQRLNATYSYGKKHGLRKTLFKITNQILGRK